MPLIGAIDARRAQQVLTGTRPKIAQTLVGVDLSGIADSQRLR